MASGEYSGSTWYGASSNNCTQADRPSSNAIDKIIIHVTQGSWSGAINWFLDPDAQVSVHYTVRSSDGFIGQSVQEKDIAWHAGNWSYNQTSIGTEHEGYINDSKWFTETMYISSAKLSAYLCSKYNIPIDRSHIIGHHEVPDPYDPGQYGGINNHTDPGNYWDWDKYMSYVRYYAGIVEDTTAPTVTSKSPDITVMTRRQKKKGVHTSTNVTATFSEEMDLATLTTSTVTLVNYGSTTPLAATVTLSSDGKTVTLDPSLSLAKKTLYTVKIEGAKDLAGNELATTTWSFRTGKR